MVEPVTTALVATAVIKSYSDYRGGKAKAKEAKRLAEIREMQAREVLKRAEYNIGVFEGQAKSFTATQQNVAAGSGIDVSSGNVLLAMEDTNQKLQEAISLERREAQWQANSLRQGADIARQEAKDIRKMFIPNLASTGVETYGQYALYKYR